MSFRPVSTLVSTFLAATLLTGCGGTTSSSSTSQASFVGSYRGIWNDSRSGVDTGSISVDSSGNITGSLTTPNGTLSASGTVDSAGAVVFTLTPTSGSAETFTGSLSAPTAGKASSIILTSDSSSTHVLYSAVIFKPGSFASNGNPFAGNYTGTAGSYGTAFTIDVNGNVAGYVVQVSGSNIEIATLSGSITIAGVISWSAYSTNTSQSYTGTLNLSSSTLSGTVTTNSTTEQLTVSKF